MTFLISFIAGAIGACGFQPLGLWPLTIAAFAVLIGLIARAPSLKSALARGYWFGVGHFALGLNWIATAFTFQAAMPAWLGWIAVLLLSLYLAVYPAAAAGLAWRWSKLPLPSAGEGTARSAEGEGLVATISPLPGSAARSPSLSREGERDKLRLVLVFAAAWIVTEWLRATLFTGFAWNPEGVVLIDSWISAAAPFVGTYGLSGILMLLAGLAYAIVRRPGWLRWPLLAGLLLIVAMDFDLVRREDKAALARQIPVRIVQPNIGQQDKWRDGYEEVNFIRLARLSGAKPGRPRLLLWPEAAVTSPLQDQRRMYYARLDALATRRGVARLLAPDELLLTGGVTYRSSDGRHLTSATNSIFAIDPIGRILGRYDKAHLVPYGEYLPARPLLSAIGLTRLAPGGVDFDYGPGARTIDLPLVGKVGFQLCYEIIFSGHVVDPRHRPNFIFNPSNDAWFGAWGPPQHLAQARLRALEEAVPVLRATPTGISAIVDAHGRIVKSLPWRTAGVIDAPLPLPHGPTLFSRFGNILPLGFALLLLLPVAVRRRTRYRQT